MTSREFFLARWTEEYPTFLKVFRALPANRPDFRPHPRSRSAAELVWLLVLELRACIVWTEGGDVSWKETPPPASLEDIITAFEKAHAELEPLLMACSDGMWEQQVRLITDGGVYEFPLGEMLWYTLFDAIHHRGQLTLYIRLSGGKVPGIYGPSADEQLK